MTRVIETDISNLGIWFGSPAGVRDVVLDRRIVAPSFASGTAPSEHEVTLIDDMCHEAVTQGRVIDFGLWPQAAIQAGGRRGGPLYTQGALAMPFSSPWIFLHSFRGPENESPQPQYCCYLVCPVAGPTGPLDIVELDLMLVVRTPVLMVGDRVALMVDKMRAAQSLQYDCIVVPSPFRHILPINGPAQGELHGAERAAAGNVLDPLMLALLMLNTRGIPRETLTVHAKLNKARARTGKPPIPPYDVVDSRPYVTALTAQRSARSIPTGEPGHHASPIPHIRRGHIREYQNGHRSFIRDTLVRVDEAQRAAFKATRSHYSFTGAP